jgi:hypothetical protein
VIVLEASTVLSLASSAWLASIHITRLSPNHSSILVLELVSKLPEYFCTVLIKPIHEIANVLEGQIRQLRIVHFGTHIRRGTINTSGLDHPLLCRG